MRDRRVIERLKASLPPTGVITETRALGPFETDGLTAFRQKPWVVALPETVEQVRAVLRICREHAGSRRDTRAPAPAFPAAPVPWRTASCSP